MCWKCGKQTQEEHITRSTFCEHCGAALHCCKGCKFYSPGSHYDCQESSVFELVRDKERENFCDWFQAKVNIASKASFENAKANDAKKAFANLFGA